LKCILIQEDLQVDHLIYQLVFGKLLRQNEPLFEFCLLPLLESNFTDA
jgi:hypothetical protein